MFGYIRPLNPELKVADLEIYKAVYCGLCRALSRSYGPAARFVLSYDFAFTTLLHLSLSETAPKLEPGRCPYKPLSRTPHLEDCPELQFSAGVAALMLYHKIRDDIADKPPLPSLLYRTALPLAHGARRRAASRYPEADAIIAAAMERQHTVELCDKSGLDAACEPSATALSELFALMSEKEDERRILSRLGYMMGRFVYTCDAVADLAQDRKNGSYNPLLHTDTHPDALRASLYLTQAEALSAYELLRPRHFRSILDNILTVGMRHTIDTVLQEGLKHEQSL